MSPQHALSIIQTLANGIDPSTGEVMADQNPFNQPDVIRALFVAVQALGAAPGAADKRAKSKPRPLNAGHSWSPEEDKQLLDGHDAGLTPKELAARHGRSKGAIDSRLVKLGRG
ncbi:MULTISPECIES: hypothetical protein [Burkholderiaceae]|uniref:hypothetical protein n=1 Tax=Burkholderiaceae TaxID=119060 RepID=UPI0004154709|nr:MULTISPECIES: hypothetical protein [Burkholderiaceae]PZR38301.1 MAG: hypothetical protein DI523_38620 [Paraburkholderia fungorum]